ncbi:MULTISPECIES: glycosyltransferase [Cyanophyceae]|uniref:glycosyltransferase n=1 Tax=Cyanophyceae TaxID=3028117 RepID=UPI0016873DCD|nr:MULTISPECIES: glycosyltransferase [Cyanophyceae]MBD1916316.1 glycosyltransferase [Phormidium sp. FACHB-77]MBD2032608.1 glycosyltransferase [Phormidium sp. FACHB-322]MBD2049980.1 glycosyltransferase [Leptolyngbya sp. FACHB-60]
MSKPLKICLIMQGGRDWIGGSEYIKNIILALGSLPAETRATFELNLLCNNKLEEETKHQIHPYLNKIYTQQDLQPITLLNRICWKLSRSLFKIDNLRLESFLNSKQIDFVYPYFSRTTRKRSYRSAAWIFDLQHKHLPHFFTSDIINSRDRKFANIAKYSSTIVLSSKTAESDLHKFFPETIDKTIILPFKTSLRSAFYAGDPLQTQRKYHLPDRFFIISNQFWQHKNHLVIFEALKLLREKSIYPIVVCTGHIYDYRQPAYSDTILQTIHKWGLAQQVFLLGLIPKIDQVQLMRRALAVIQPSLFEGWSTLVEDARCLGKHLILSDLPVNKEQNPPHSIFFKRDSAEHLTTFLAEHWEHLMPGPNPENEAMAKANSLKEIKIFGEAFLEISQTSG